MRAVAPLAPGIHELWIEPDGHAGLDFRARAVRLAAPGAATPGACASTRLDRLRARRRARAALRDQGQWRLHEADRGGRHPARAPGSTGPMAVSARAPTTTPCLPAGGVGLAPILALLRASAATPAIAGRYASSMPAAGSATWCSPTSSPRSARDLDLAIVRVVDEAQRPAGTEPGPLSRALLERSLPAVERGRLGCCICAPPGMIDATEAMLVELGVPPRRITSERFRYRYGAGSPVARRAQRVYLAVAGVLVLAAITFAAAH
ncbi:MAG: hypothetical protein U5K43_07420 [Halofilum sp. (in: g-proteobacteria)]|nr:hypothetical protein [Halofilum sp. (in: g-proteobacteria)]